MRIRPATRPASLGVDAIRAQGATPERLAFSRLPESKEQASLARVSHQRVSLGPPDEHSAGPHERKWRAWARPVIHLVA